MKKRILLFAVVILALSGSVYAYNSHTKHVVTSQPLKTPVVAQKAPEKPKVVPSVAEMIADTNVYRSNAGITPLAESVALDKSASEKCHEMENGLKLPNGAPYSYFAHENPETGRQSGLDYVKKELPNATHWGENLARSSIGESSQVIIYDFFNEIKAPPGETGHRANILHSDYILIGMAICSSNTSGQDTGSYFVVQHFAD